MSELTYGTRLDRYGDPRGGWLYPKGDPLEGRSLPPDTLNTQKLYSYEIIGNDLPPGWKIEESKAAPWFGDKGGGTQYRILKDDGTTGSVRELLRRGVLKEIPNEC